MRRKIHEKIRISQYDVIVTWSITLILQFSSIKIHAISLPFTAYKI